MGKRGGPAQQQALSIVSLRGLMADYTTKSWPSFYKPLLIIRTHDIKCPFLLTASPDGRYLAMLTTFGRMYAIDMTNQSLIPVETALPQGYVTDEDEILSHPIRKLVFSADSTHLIARDSDNVVKQWNMNQLDAKPELLGVYPEGTYPALDNNNNTYYTHNLNSSAFPNQFLGRRKLLEFVGESLDSIVTLQIPHNTSPKLLFNKNSGILVHATLSPCKHYLAALSTVSLRLIAGERIEPLILIWNLKHIEKRQTAANNLMEHLFAALANDNGTLRNIRKIMNRTIINRTLQESSPLVSLLAALHAGNLEDAIDIARTAHGGSYSVGPSFTFDDFQQEEYQNKLFSVTALELCAFLDTPAQGNLVELAQEMAHANQELTVALNAQAYID